MLHIRTLGRRLATGAATALVLATLPLGVGTTVAAAATGPAVASLDGSGSFSDSFTLPSTSDTTPMYGLNVGLDKRETGSAKGIAYTRVSGPVGSNTNAPDPSDVQTGNAQHPNKLGFFNGGTSAVMLGAPALADANGQYTISTTVEPVVGQTGSSDWASLALSRSHRSTGIATNSDVDLGLTVASNGTLTLYHAKTPFWTGQVTPNTGVFTVSLTVFTGAVPTVALSINGVAETGISTPSSVTRWPSSSYLYLGASQSNSSEVTTFGDGNGNGLTVSNVDTVASASIKPLVDTFDGAPNNNPDHGLNDDLSARQPTVATSGYTVASGAGDPTASVQVNSPAYPNVLSLTRAAVRLNKPVTADLSGTYTVHAVLTPVANSTSSTSSTDSSSLVVSNSATATGSVQGSDVALGLQIQVNGALQLFQAGTPLWSAQQQVTAAPSYDVSMAVLDGTSPQATLVVNGTSFTVPTPTNAYPRDGYVYLGGSANANDVSTVDDLRLSMVGGLSFDGYFDSSDVTDATASSPVNRAPEAAGWTNLNQYFSNAGYAGDPTTGFLDYCLPSSCILSVDKYEASPTALAQLVQILGASIEKVGAVYLQDEPYLDHGPGNPALTQQQLRDVVTNVRAAFPDKPMVLTMAYTTIGDTTNYPVPAGVDLVGFDRYCHGRAVLANLLGTLEQEVGGAASNTHMFLVPEASTDRLGGDCRDASDGAVANALPDYEALAAADPRVTYLMGFRWRGIATATSTTPQSLASQQAMGSAIINGTPIRPASSVGVYHPSTGTFYEGDRAGDTLSHALPFGNPNWKPLAGHWAGPGPDTIGAYDPSTGTFYLSNDNATASAPIRFGNPGWIPLAGDWTGSGKDTIGAYDPSTGIFYLTNDNAHSITPIKFGNPGWIPLAGDWTGSGKDTIGAYDPSTGTFYLSNDNSTSAITKTFGNPGWTPMVGDWNGDGTDTIGALDPSTMRFYLSNDNATAATSFLFGSPGDVPFAGIW
ncbi:cell wall assembly regulator SMI1 [Kitasatospora sp. MAA4]|uniref:hypothetical protein n=1 Tax=Kitasatospora sp. MAA4 TaxID=3035093 RepID=UPI002473FB2A|nr:hypothetical protein [Kitasatospora sp. MAA4]MDH6134886.1 cell wall assembly regulator SMI1 [Kitasatospora sp. MAA4]